METLPSADADRISPVTTKSAKQRKALKGEKVKKEKKVKDVKDEFDEMAEAKSSLSDSAKKFKQTKINFGKVSKSKTKTKTPWSDEEDISGEGSEPEEAPPVPRQKPGSRAAASKAQKFQEVRLS